MSNDRPGSIGPDDPLPLQAPRAGPPPTEADGELAREMHRVLALYLGHESAVARHAARFDDVCRARAASHVVLEALAGLRASRAQAQRGRALLREAARAQVLELRAARVPIERVLRRMRESMGAFPDTTGAVVPHLVLDELGREVVQWAIEDYFAPS